jgi:hypothetical protein
MFTLLPKVLAELPAPLCRSCRKADKKDCRAAVLAGAASALVLLDPVVAPDVTVPVVGVAEVVVDVAEVVPPKSPISLVNAAFKFDSVFAKREGVPAAEDVVPVPWLLPKSLMRAVSSAAMPWRPYRSTPMPLPEVVATGVVATGVVTAGVVATPTTVAGAVVAGVVVAPTAVAGGVGVSVVVAPGVVLGVLFAATGAVVAATGVSSSERSPP